jgi:sigma-B regulation protein RsbU (phosphoserine phosphatase)
VLRGAMLAVRDIGASLVCVAGGVLGSAQNFAFDAFGRHNVGGIVALTSAIASGVGPERTGEWLRRFNGTPVCCVGVAVDGYPSLRVDGACGIRELMRHLIEVHQHRRIAFIQGPPLSVEAEQRFLAYQEALTAAGLALEPRWVLDGDFTIASGARAIRTLFDERQVTVGSLDAIVAANDFMAIGAIDELARRGIAVPERLAVVGFDDVDSARTTRPPLTTVRQPSEGLGRAGVLTVHHLATRPHAELSPAALLATELVIRRSCGCNEAEVSLGDSTRPPQPGRSLETSFIQRRQIIMAETVRAAHGSFGAAGPGWEHRLLDALIAEVRGAEPGALNQALQQLLRKLERSEVSASAVQDVLTALRRQSLPPTQGDVTSRERLEEAIHDARATAAALALRAEAARVRAPYHRFQHFARKAYATLFSDPHGLSQAAAEQLPALGVEACIVVRISDANRADPEVRVQLGFGPGGRRAAGETVALSTLSSHALLARSSRTRVLLPLVVNEEPVGAAMLAVSSVDGAMIEQLRDLFSVVLKVTNLERATTRG